MKFFIADTLISNATVVTANSQNDILQNGCIAIVNDRIEYIGKDDPSRIVIQSENRIDAEGGIVMPGLINTHTHMPMSVFRGYADDMALMTWLNDYMFPAEAKYISPETVRTGTLLSCAEMLLGGITTVCDGYFYEGTVAKAVSETGIRSVLAQGVIDFPAPGVPDPEKNIDACSEFIDNWKNSSPLLSPSIFCHSPYTCSSKTLLKAKELSRKHNVLFQIHLAETLSEIGQIQKEQGKTPVAYLEHLGVMDDKTLFVHAVHLTEKDIDIIQKSGAGISHNPESNMKLSSGISPVHKIVEAGIPVGLGTDSSASNNDLDLFSEMDTAAKLHKVNTLNPSIMSAETVFKMATIGGAKALGISDSTGSIEVGKQADLIIIDTNKPHLVPMYNPVSHIVYSVKSSDVRDVFVAGKQLVKNRKFITLDLPLILKEAKDIQNIITKPPAKIIHGGK